MLLGLNLILRARGIEVPLAHVPGDEQPSKAWKAQFKIGIPEIWFLENLIKRRLVVNQKKL